MCVTTIGHDFFVLILIIQEKRDWPKNKLEEASIIGRGAIWT